MAVDFNDKALADRIRKAVMPEVIRGTEAIRAEAISLILNTEKNGRSYRHRGVTHRASAAGEPPASDTGTLVNNISTSYDFNTYTGTVTVTVDYGLFLEYGTEKMEPRPYLRPAIANKTPEMEQRIAAAIRREFGP